MPSEKAAHVLGSFLGLPTPLAPGAPADLSAEQIEAILEETSRRGNKTLQSALFSHADAVTTSVFGDRIYYRGIVEFSNVCANDCGYCGIRKHMPGLRRYTMPASEVVEVARWAFENRMGTLMLQAGELPTPQRLAYLVDVVRQVREATIAQDAADRSLDPKSLTPELMEGMGLRVALSVGELERADYEALYAAGARRYLLRIETSNPELYAALHPAAMSWERRVQCLRTLQGVGFQLGTGIMVGLPGQTLADLASDVRFFKDMGANMIGCGPYITEAGTPVAEMWEALHGPHVDKKAHMAEMLQLTTRVNALARIVTGGANIAATTALQAIDPNGREIALRRGANILMPILTPTKYREHYQLYEGKPCITDTADECRKCLNARVGMIGKRIQPGAWGDPPNFSGSVIQQNSASVGALARGFATLPAAAAVGDRRGAHSGAAALGPVQPMASAEQSPQWTRAQQAAGALGADLPRPTGPERGSDVPRLNIGVFGTMNAGKSTLMNAITRQETSIVDATPGTTADVKISLMELHDVGPVKLFDTAGIDEEGELGSKKRRKTLQALKESDVALVVVDVARIAPLATDPTALAASLRWEADLLGGAAHAGAVPLLLLNLKGLTEPAQDERVAALLQQIQTLIDPQRTALSLALDLHDTDGGVAGRVASFVQDGASRSRAKPYARSLPDWALASDAVVFLNIPMDAETPSMRLLRPQALVQEEAIRYWATTLGYRMDLAAARSGDPERVAVERARFMRALQPVLDHKGPKIMVTDSQAVDVVHPWTLDEAGAPLLPFTTFSICMIHRQSGGRLPVFVEGLQQLERLQAGDTVLVAEACNHNRITDTCNDIGMVQIPRHLERFAGPGVRIEHAFGREYPELSTEAAGGGGCGGGCGAGAGAAGGAKYAMALHCGGCMIDAQKMRARIQDMQDAGLPVTNYGLFLSYMTGKDALARALQPWGVGL